MRKYLISGFNTVQDVKLEAGTYTLVAYAKSMYSNVYTFALGDGENWTEYDIDVVQGQLCKVWLTFTIDKKATKFKPIANNFSESLPVYVTDLQLTKGNIPVEAGASPFDIDQILNDLHDGIDGIEDFTNEAFMDGLLSREEKTQLRSSLEAIGTIVESVKGSYNKLLDNPFISDATMNDITEKYDALIASWESDKDPRGLKPVILWIVLGDNIVSKNEREEKDRALNAFNDALYAYNQAEKEVYNDVGANSIAPIITEDGFWAFWDKETETFIPSEFSAIGDDGHAPIIRDGYWYEWNPESAEEDKYEPTGVRAEGVKGDGYQQKFFLSDTKPAKPTGDAEDWSLVADFEVVPSDPEVIGDNLFSLEYLYNTGWGATTPNEARIDDIPTTGKDVINPSVFKSNTQYRMVLIGYSGNTRVRINYTDGTVYDSGYLSGDFIFRYDTTVDKTIASIKTGPTSYMRLYKASGFYELTSISSAPIWTIQRSIVSGEYTEWSEPRRWTGEKGNDGRDGKDGTDGTDGQDGKDGADGLPPKITGTITQYAIGNSKTTYPATGWGSNIKEVTEELPYLWSRQKITYDNGDILYTGYLMLTNITPITYMVGEWDCRVKYTRSEKSYPIVTHLRGTDNKPLYYYPKNEGVIEYTWFVKPNVDYSSTWYKKNDLVLYENDGSNGDPVCPLGIFKSKYDDNKYLPSVSSWWDNVTAKYAPNGIEGQKLWEFADGVELIITDALMANFGKIASAVFSGDHMISQQGVNNSGVPSTDYKNFGNVDENENPLFTPNIDIDFFKGLLKALDVEISGTINAKNGTIEKLTMAPNGVIELPPTFTSRKGKIDNSGIQLVYEGSNSQRIEWYTGLGTFSGRIAPNSEGHLNLSSSFGVGIQSQLINIGTEAFSGNINIGSGLSKIDFNGSSINNIKEMTHIGYTAMASSTFTIDSNTALTLLHQAPLSILTSVGSNSFLKNIYMNDSYLLREGAIKWILNRSAKNMSIASDGNIRINSGDSPVLQAYSLTPFVYSAGYWYKHSDHK